jgi:hypothetical protein
MDAPSRERNGSSRRRASPLRRDGRLSAMSGCSDEELAVVRRFLLDMTEAIERHSHPAGP